MASSSMDPVRIKNLVLIAQNEKGLGCKQLVDGRFITKTPKTSADYWFAFTLIKETDLKSKSFGQVGFVVVSRWFPKSRGLVYEEMP